MSSLIRSYYWNRSFRAEGNLCYSSKEEVSAHPWNALSIYSRIFSQKKEALAVRMSRSSSTGKAVVVAQTCGAWVATLALVLPHGYLSTDLYLKQQDTFWLLKLPLLPSLGSPPVICIPYNSLKPACPHCPSVCPLIEAQHTGLGHSDLGHSDTVCCVVLGFFSFHLSPMVSSILFFIWCWPSPHTFATENAVVETGPLVSLTSFNLDK